MENLLNNTIVLDTETTSLDNKVAEIIEFGFVLKIDNEWQQFNELHKPSVNIEPEISAVTNITNKMVADKPSFKSVVDDFDTVLSTAGSPDELIVVSHNIEYDRGVFENSYPDSHVLNYEWVCTLKMARKLYTNDPTVKKFNLPYLRYRFELDIPDDTPTHRASADALVAAKLFEFLLDEAKAQGVFDNSTNDKDTLIEWINSPTIIERMPFGKHKGVLLEEVPMDYWKWALANLDSLNEDSEKYDKDFATSVIKVLEEAL